MYNDDVSHSLVCIVLHHSTDYYVAGLCGESLQVKQYAPCNLCPKASYRDYVV